MPTKRSQEFMDLKIGKASKPLIEKRRRARINQSLAQLKSLVIDPKTTENSRQAKLEKADILELTVKHLRDIKKEQSEETVENVTSIQKKFEKGFSECVRQVELFFGSIGDPQLMSVEGNLKKKLKDHLWRSLQCFQVPEAEPSEAQKETFSHPATSCAPDYNVSNQSYKRPASSSVASYDDEMANSNTIDLSFHSSKKRKYDETEVYSCDSYQSVIRSTTLERNGNNYYEPSFRNITSADSSRSYSPYDDFGSDMGVPEGPLLNYSLEKSDEGQCSFYPNSAECGPEVVSLKTKSNDSQYHHQGTSQTFLGNSPTKKRLEPKNTHYDPERLGNFTRQIPLIPRRLQNGEWALVLPGSLTLNEHDVQNPLSAFRFVLPSSLAEDQVVKRNGSVSSPFSSSVSDMSMEEFSSRSDGEIRFDYDGNNDPWRPW
ncbi:hypothetical protein JTE90_021032 [Oedothorax gibbosus]|uniref:BHLH domain-containing protein n=1 Tax=Oedothorax gibbosus TaxID=931172 RepID=A0AAV6U6L9_9ARAC|nr:hypothetical protein JTE90_021032 [Oedothorax gibbosus]